MKPDVTKPLRYRKATIADRVAVKQVIIDAYGIYQSVLLPAYWEKMKAILEHDDTASMLLAQAAAYVCTHGDLIAGVAFVMPAGHPTAIFSAEWAYIRMLGVLPEYRGLGVATGLMERCIKRARDAGEKVLALHTGAYQSAWRIYERLGFQRMKSLEQMYGQEYWLYTLELTQSGLQDPDPGFAETRDRPAFRPG